MSTNRVAPSTSPSFLVRACAAGGSVPDTVATGPDGSLWVTAAGTNQVLKLTDQGAPVAQYVLPTPASLPNGLTPGPDGNIWVAYTYWYQWQRCTVAQATDCVDIPGDLDGLHRDRGRQPQVPARRRHRHQPQRQLHSRLLSTRRRWRVHPDSRPDAHPGPGHRSYRWPATRGRSHGRGAGAPPPSRPRSCPSRGPRTPQPP